MKITYFTRRLLCSSGGGEQCDYYLQELLSIGNNIKIISEKKSYIIKQYNKRNFFNKLLEELNELIFYLKNIKHIYLCDYVIITGRSLSASIISILRPNRIIHNIHGKTNKIALLIFKFTNPIIFFWGNSYEMCRQPKLKRSLKKLIPSSSTIRKFINNPIYENKNFRENQNLNLLWVGRFEPIKDPILFLDSINYLFTIFSDFNISIIGGGSMDKKIRNHFNKFSYSLKEKVNLIGQIENSKIESFYNKADILVITSITESFSIVILEAIINNTKIVSVPIKELEKYNFSKFIEFSLSRDPKDIGNKIFEVHQSNSSTKDDFKIIKDIIGSYKKQSKDILKWFK